MIVAKRKPFNEIVQSLEVINRVLLVGCGTCVAVCMAGGEKEVSVLNAELDMARKLDENPIELVNEHSRNIKNELSSRVKNQLRKIPELHYYVDDSLDYIDNINRLLKS